MLESKKNNTIPLRAWPVAGFFVLMAPFGAGGAMALPALQALGGALGAPWRKLLPGSVAAWGFLAAFAGFVGWAAASASWSINPNHGQALRLAGGAAAGLLFVAGAGADAQTRRLVRAAGAAGAAVLTGLLLIEAFAGMPLNYLDQPGVDPGVLMRNPARGATVLMVLIWGVVAGLAGGKELERTAWRLLLVAAAVTALQFDMEANAAAFAGGAAGYVFGRMSPRAGVLVLCGGAAFWLLAAPFLTPLVIGNPHVQQLAPDSWAMRMEIWRFAIEKIHEHFLTGWGLDSARVFDEPRQVRGIDFHVIPLHPHSGSLQVWLETGAVGAGLGAAALLSGGWALSRALKNEPAGAAAACGVIGAATVIANVSFGAWQEWWLAAMFAGAALASAARRPELAKRGV